MEDWRTVLHEANGILLFDSSGPPGLRANSKGIFLGFSGALKGEVKEVVGGAEVGSGDGCWVPLVLRC